MILLSELSRRRIRSIQKLIRVGRNEVVVVLRVDKEKGASLSMFYSTLNNAHWDYTGYIDLSKRRVSPEDITKCEERYTKSKTVASIMRHVASRSGGIPEPEKEDHPDGEAAVAGETEEERLESLYEQIAWPVGKKYGHPYDAFKLALTCVSPSYFILALLPTYALVASRTKCSAVCPSCRLRRSRSCGQRLRDVLRRSPSSSELISS